PIGRRLERDVASPPAAADAIDFAVPVVGQAIDHPDVRAGNRVQRAFDLAEGGQAFRRISRDVSIPAPHHAQRSAVERGACLRAGNSRYRRGGAGRRAIGGGAAASQQGERQGGQGGSDSHVFSSRHFKTSVRGEL